MVQADAQILQRALVTRQVPSFFGGDDMAAREIHPTSTHAVGAGYPQNVGQVTQSPGAFFDVRLQVVGRVVEASVPQLLL